MEETLKALREEYEEVSHMLHWRTHDGKDARMICGTVMSILERLGYNLDEVDWVVK